MQQPETTLAEFSSEIREQHKRLLSWAEIFDPTSPQEDKIVTLYFIKVMKLTCDYGIRVEFNISAEQYFGGIEMG